MYWYFSSKVNLFTRNADINIPEAQQVQQNGDTQNGGYFLGDSLY